MRRPTNHATSKAYETLICSLIHQQMDGVAGVELIEITHNTQVIGLSGYKHQIDILYRLRIWATEILVVVECKQYRRKVSVEDLLQFRSRVDDLRAHKGVFVTTTGYQTGAIEFARANRIALLIARGTKPETEMVIASIRPYPLLKQCKDQIERLSDAYAVHAHGLGNRILINDSQTGVMVRHEGIEVLVRPGDSYAVGNNRESCKFAQRDGDAIFFEWDRLGQIHPTRVIKCLIVDYLLTPPDGGLSEERDRAAIKVFDDGGNKLPTTTLAEYFADHLYGRAPLFSAFWVHWILGPLFIGWIVMLIVKFEPIARLLPTADTNLICLLPAFMYQTFAGMMVWHCARNLKREFWEPWAKAFVIAGLTAFAFTLVLFLRATGFM